MEGKKQKTHFELCLDSANRRISKIQGISVEIQNHLRLNNINSAFSTAFKMAEQSEKLTLLCRELPAYTGHPRAGVMMTEVIQKNFPVEIGFTNEGWFCVRIPSLLPKKNRGGPDFYTEPMYYAMRVFWRNKNPVRYPYNVTVFRHVYSHARPERHYRDHDNIELNRVLDIVSVYVMVDDSPMRCRHYYCSAPGSAERTEIYVIPRNDFGRWLAQEDNIPDEGVEIFENLK